MAGELLPEEMIHRYHKNSVFLCHLDSSSRQVSFAGLQLYLLCGFAVVGCSRYGHQGRPVLQKHLPLTDVAPDPERGQVHCQVVLLSLMENHLLESVLINVRYCL